jgi:hypothetical protein
MVRLVRTMLEREDWDEDTRSISWEMDGKRYTVAQLTNLATRDPAIIKTRYLRDGYLHRLEGPADCLMFRGTIINQSFHVNGTRYTEEEFEFFIKGMVL